MVYDKIYEGMTLDHKEFRDVYFLVYDKKYEDDDEIVLAISWFRKKKDFHLGHDILVISKDKLSEFTEYKVV